jgi:hypothetical protein
MGTLYTLYKADKPEFYELGKGEWFRIGQSEDYTVFRIADLWTVDTLTRFVRKAVSWRVGDINTAAAKATAEHIFAWAGDDRIVMVDDTVSFRPVLKELGLDIKGFRYRQKGSRWEALPDDYSTLTEKEQEENAVFVQEIQEEKMKMFDDFWKIPS